MAVYHFCIPQQVETVVMDGVQEEGRLLSFKIQAHSVCIMYRNENNSAVQ